MKKKLMKINLDKLVSQPESGMGFQIISSSDSFYAVLSNGFALPLSNSDIYYDINDLFNDKVTLDEENDNSVLIDNPNSFSSRFSALAGLSPLTQISSKYTGIAGAIPLIFSETLLGDTIFYRLVNSPVDYRFDRTTRKLKAGTYLTTELDKTFTNSGFATVARYALPIPLPASYVYEYELPIGTEILIGTVSPMFGQSGGGVEIKTKDDITIRRISRYKLPDY